MKLLTLLFLVVCSCSAFADDSENNQDAAEILHTGTKAVPIKVEAPIYPPIALRRGIEGWVGISLTVKADGNIARQTCHAAQRSGSLDFPVQEFERRCQQTISKFLQKDQKRHGNW